MSVENELAQLRAQVAALTARVYQLEQRSAPRDTDEHLIDAQPAIPLVAPPPPPPTPSQPLEFPSRAERGTWVNPPVQTSLREGGSLENTIGSQWLNRVGIVAVLVGVSYFLKLAFENQWIGPATQVLIGIVAGIGIVWWSERFRRTGSVNFSYSLKAVGIGVLYLSLWAAFQQYHLVPAAVAFLGMIVVTATTTYFALRQSTWVLAALALLGGFLTPVLLSTGQNNEAVLLSYVLLLDVGVLALQRFHRWPGLMLGAFFGTLVLYVAWETQYFTPAAYGETVFFVSALFLVFAIAPFFSTYAYDVNDAETKAGILLAIANGFTYLFEIYALLDRTVRAGNAGNRLAVYALGIAGLYFGLALALRRREEDSPSTGSLMWLVHQGLAASFLTIAIALKLDGSWITFGWLIEAIALYFAAVRSGKPAIKLFAQAVFLVAVARLVLFDSFLRTAELSPIFNQRFALYVLAIAILAATLYFERSESAEPQPWSAVAVIMINVLALLALNLEVSDYFAVAIRATRDTLHTAPPVEMWRATRSLTIERDFTYSAVSLAYGVALIAVGFWKQSAFLRWQAIVLIAAIVLKVFVYDVSALERVYRVASFIILGAILLAISYAYQKDWLGLQKSEKS